MAKPIQLNLTGTKETERALKKVQANVRRKVLVEALTKTARQGVSAAKGMLKTQRTGMLKKAMAFKTRSKGKDGGYRVIGAARGNKATVPGSKFDTIGRGATVTLSGKTKGGKIRTAKISKRGTTVTSGLPVDPAKYAHLVEGGRKSNVPVKAKAMYFRIFGTGAKSIKVFAKKVKAVKAQPFMRPASEKLKLLYPYNVAQALRKVWP